MARTQTLVQLSDLLLAVLDERAARTGRSRSDLIREAIESYLGDDVEAEIDRQIVQGYERAPQKSEPSHELNARRAIEEEPW